MGCLQSPKIKGPMVLEAVKTRITDKPSPFYKKTIPSKGALLTVYINLMADYNPHFTLTLSDVNRFSYLISKVHNFSGIQVH